MNTQGKRLQTIRKLLNITQEELGKTLNVSKQVISNIEADRVLLNNDKLVSIGQNYKVNTDYILLGRGQIFINNENYNIKNDIKEIIKTMYESGELNKY